MARGVSNGFDVNEYRRPSLLQERRYEKRIAELQKEGKATTAIEAAVTKAIENIDDGTRSFVIYGEPQSGKTEMMIALTARLLDEGHRIVVVLLNDSVQLLEQNLDRFARSGLDPSPKKFNEVLDPNVRVTEGRWIIFCKKNTADLLKLIDKLGKCRARLVIDDEADVATPNAKINQQQQTRINQLVEKLLGGDGIYIGVTATPARLDLNNTFKNDNEKWVDFPPHPGYTGHEVFFPTSGKGFEQLGYRLELLPTHGDEPKYLRKALLSFLVNVAFLNTEGTRPLANYTLLVHTSGRKADHSKDYEQIVGTLSVLQDQHHARFEAYVREIYERATQLHPGSERTITKFIVDRIGQSAVIVMNSNAARNSADYRRATHPAALFTIAIGGNIVSRGVTFENLLGMFFTRDVRHKLQQDTYIQRARMFGSRGSYLPYFELYIPESLYLDWQKCFVFHTLAVSAIRAGWGTPVWMDNDRLAVTASGSINKARVVLDSGEMSWSMFTYDPRLNDILSSKDGALGKLEQIFAIVGENALPRHVLEFISNFAPYGDASVAVHPTGMLGDTYASADVANISRAKGFMASHDLERQRYPRAIHHLKMYTNPAGQARVFYKYLPDKGNIRFLKTSNVPLNGDDPRV